MDNMKHRRLQELDRSDFEIVEGEPDIRGWDVKTTTSQKIGEVEELILDAQQKKVRYMVVDLDDNELKLDHKKVAIPIGLAELDKEDDDVYIPRITADQLRSLPDYDEDNFDHDVERRICSVFGRKFDNSNLRSSTTTREETREVIRDEERRNSRDEKVDPDFYRHEYYNLDTLYKNRLHEAEPVKNDSEYDNGLKLWERRSEGTVLPEDRNREGSYNTRGISEDARMERVKSRRHNYEERRYKGGENPRSRSIVDRIRDEGLQDEH